MTATSTFGLEAIVTQELKDLGFKELNVANGAVTSPTEESAICRTNLWPSTADRIRLKVGEFKAIPFDQLFEQTRVLHRSDLIPASAAFPAEGKTVQSTLSIIL